MLRAALTQGNASLLMGSWGTALPKNAPAVLQMTAFAPKEELVEYPGCSGGDGPGAVQLQGFSSSAVRHKHQHSCKNLSHVGVRTACAYIEMRLQYPAKYMQNNLSLCLYKAFPPAGCSFQLTRQQASETQLCYLPSFLFPLSV